MKKKFALPKYCEVSKIRLEHSSSSTHNGPHHQTIHQKNSKSQGGVHAGVVNTVQGNLSQYENSNSSKKNCSNQCSTGKENMDCSEYNTNANVVD